MLGAYSYLIELWGSPEFAADINDDGRVSDEEMMLWIDTELHGEGWIIPHRVSHPDLGEVWIGGSPKKHIRRTPPSRYIEMEAEKNADFVLYVASQFPKVEIEKVTVRPEAGNLYWVDVTLKNDRTFPTSSDMANELGIAEKDKLLFRSSGGVQLVPIPDDPTRIDARNTGETATGVGEEVHEFRLLGKGSQTFRYLVSGSGWVEFEVDSFYGGSVTERVDLR
jgi:hypothetical protein